MISFVLYLLFLMFAGFTIGATVKPAWKSLIACILFVIVADIIYFSTFGFPK